MSPAAIRGRVIALYTTVSYGVQLLAAVWVGWIAQDFIVGVSSAIQLNAALLVAGALGIFLFRRIVLKHQYVLNDVQETISERAAESTASNELVIEAIDSAA